MNKIIKTGTIILLGTSLLTVSGCNKTAQGGGFGALLGGGLCAIAGGSASTCMAIAAATAVIGASIGSNMDKRDQEKREAALRQAILAQNTTDPVSWTNPDTNNTGTVKPLRTFVDPKSGNQCSEIEEVYIKADGSTYTESYTVCTDKNGGIYTFDG